MKKIPTLFRRDPNTFQVTGELKDENMGDILANGVATEKIDGAACAVIGGQLYKRYDAKNGKPAPIDGIACQDPDPVTGHWPFWVPCKRADPADRWFWSAFDNYPLLHDGSPKDGTYEAYGKHFAANRYRRETDTMEGHGLRVLDVPNRTFEGIRSFLENNNIEGIVFWLNGEPAAKIKRKDFGIPWPGTD